MTGKWLRRREDEPPPRFSRLRLHLDDSHVLHYCDLRLFGRFRLVPGGRFAALPELAGLGPDPLRDGIDPAALHARLARTRRPVKVALMDQSLLAGVGNIYASEALFRARIDPRRRASTLSAREASAIARAIVLSMRHAITRQMSPEIVYVEEPGSKNPFRVYDRAGERCPRCRKEPLRRIVQAQRSTFFCPRCQRRA
jgi:formamidopyrimidine-DNA glycosylase